MAGSKPGERRGGRKKGTPNKATADIKALAMVHGPAAVLQLAALAKKAESEAARVAAIKELLDRAYGKAAQAVQMSGPDNGPIQTQDVPDHQRDARPGDYGDAGKGEAGRRVSRLIRSPVSSGNR